MTKETPPSIIQRLSWLVEEQTARYRWLETEGATLEEHLNEKERLIFAAMMMGASLERLSLSLGVTRERVRQLELRIINEKLADVIQSHPIPGMKK